MFKVVKISKHKNNFKGENIGGLILFKMAKGVLSDKIYLFLKLIHIIKYGELYN